MTLSVHDTKVGVAYHVEIEDCCVAGSFRATVTAKIHETADPSYINRVVFDNGVVLTELNGVRFTLASPR